ncbi:hypothetical protein I7V28_19585 [Lelliottia amnigena]|uniref:hypothetical protein n=1 Tax=Lelliottia TaxID=1330545 RepID=UPI00192AF5A2|nr:MULTISPECIES: hypothetical protein [Lelliottia]MBL5885706.1 hypothetical protein [Lelliottia aquatilis]MBL5923285.1 hypothetical protein [Lelliottia amnigena]MBL5932194.1 hypothetical protein [Lelliottia amnigena]
MKIKLRLVAMLLLLTGCDQKNEVVGNPLKLVFSTGSLQLPSVVIIPGWPMDDHGRRALVYGNTVCPTGTLSDANEAGCVVIQPEDSSVSVSVIASRSGSQVTQQEIWSVERLGTFPDDVIRLKRPDSTYVSMWKGTGS